MTVTDQDTLSSVHRRQSLDEALSIGTPNNITNPARSGDIWPISDGNVHDLHEALITEESFDELRHLVHLDRFIQQSPRAEISPLRQETTQYEEMRVQVPTVEPKGPCFSNSKNVYSPHCDFSKHWLPMLSLRNRRDEGIEFPDHADRLQHLLLMTAENEALQLDDKYIQLVLGEENNDAQAGSAISMLPRGLIERPKLFSDSDMRISPPLISASDTSIPSHPSGVATVIDLTSEPPSSMETRAGTFLQQVQDGTADSDIQETGILQTPSPDTNVCGPSEVQQWTGGDELETPLVENSPQVNMDPINFATLFTNMVDMSTKSDDMDSDPFENMFFDTVAARALDVESKLEEETIDPIDTISRVPIPTKNFAIEQPEWKSRGYSAKDHLRLLFEGGRELFAFPSPPSHCLVTGLLKWTPIPVGTGKVSLDEHIYNVPCAFQDNFSNDSTPHVNCCPLSTEISVLVFDDEELEDAELSYDTTGTAMAYDKEELPQEQNKKHDDWWSSIKRPRKMASVDESLSMLSKSNDLAVSSRLLANYIELHTTKRPRIDVPPDLNRSKYNSISVENSDAINQNTPAVVNHPPIENIQLTLELPAQKASVVVSLSIGQAIFRELGNHWPSNLLIDIDYSRLGLSNVAMINASAQTPVEADLSLSPTTGIMIATLLEVRQKPLPGSVTETAIRAKTRKLASKYETLYVLVSQDTSCHQNSGNPSPSDMVGYADFIQFTTTLGAAVTCCFIAGQKSNISQWIIALMCRYSASSLRFNDFMTGEITTWEVFFCRAGMNIFAAQVCSKTIFQRHGPDGISALFSMSPEKRMAKYAPLIGEKNIRQLSRAVDQPRGE